MDARERREYAAGLEAAANDERSLRACGIGHIDEVVRMLEQGDWYDAPYIKGYVSGLRVLATDLRDNRLTVAS